MVHTFRIFQNLGTLYSFTYYDDQKQKMSTASLFLATFSYSHYSLDLVMFEYGEGYCDTDYYDGWDDMGTYTPEHCKRLCLQEEQCTFASFYSRVLKRCTHMKIGGFKVPSWIPYSEKCDDFHEATCHRYYGTKCQHTLHKFKMFYTFMKGGLFIFFYSHLIVVFFDASLTHILPLSLYEGGKSMMYSRPSISKTVGNQKKIRPHLKRRKFPKICQHFSFL